MTAHNILTFHTLTFRNFMSYGNNTTTITFGKPGTTLIVGENCDNTEEGTGSNGVGKSTILNGLLYAVYDRILNEDVSKDGMINNINKKELEVTLEFTAMSGVRYKIIRQRKMKAGADGNKTTLIEYQPDGTGKDIAVDAVGTNKKIEEIIGMPFELFVRIVAFSATSDSFLKLPATSTTGPNQRDFIEDLFGLSTITQKADKLKAVIKDTKQAVEAAKSRISLLQAERDRHTQQVANAVKRQQQWELVRAESVAAAEAKLAKIVGVDVEGQRQIYLQCQEVSAAIRAIDAEQTRATKECATYSTQFNALVREIEALAASKCPRCHQHFEGASVEISSKEVELDEMERALEALGVKIAENTSTLTELDELYAELQQQLTVDNIEEIARIQSDAANIKHRVEELKQETNPHDDAVAELDCVTFDVIERGELDDLQKELDHQNFLLKLLTKSDSFVRKSLLNKYLPFLNGRVQHYLQMLGLPHVVEFQEDLSAKISKMGVEIKFGNLSTGQRARVDFAFSIAFKDVRERLHGRANVCLFDEVLDFGLDAVGVMACAKLLKYIARTTESALFIISHRNEIDSVFDSKMTVQMIKDFSYIKQEGSTSVLS